MKRKPGRPKGSSKDQQVDWNIHGKYKPRSRNKAVPFSRLANKVREELMPKKKFDKVPSGKPGEYYNYNNGEYEKYTTGFVGKDNLLETGKMTINYRADQPEDKLYEIIGRLYVESQTEKAVWTAPEVKND